MIGDVELLLVTTVVVVVVVAVAGWVTMRMVRRLRAVTEAGRRRLDAARARIPLPGLGATPAYLLRRRLAEEMRSTREVLAGTSPDTRIFVAEAQPILTELSTTAAALDAELVAIDRFPDPRQQRAALATIAPQVEQVIATSYSARQTMLQTAAADRRRHLASLSEAVANEAASLATYQRERRDLTL